MFGKKKLRKDLPPIDISKKKVKGLFGKTKLVPTTKKEQRELKAMAIKEYPDRYFIDNLKEYNSISPSRAATMWIDEIEIWDAFLD